MTRTGSRCWIRWASARARLERPANDGAQSPKPAAGVPAFTADAVMAHVKVLASDEFEGRAPGTKGEDLTVAYISDQFRKAGLKPGHTDGTYIQKVPMVGITADPATSLVFTKGDLRQTLAFKDDVVAWTKRVEERVSIDATDVVFVGYGVQAPEFQWDDYKGVDLAGKTVIMLVNDPPVPDPADPSRLDPKTFGGRAMTYYGRWTYKYEMGAEKKAAAVFIVHETGPAAYPFSVVQSKVTEQFDLVTADRNRGRAAIEGWITLDQAKKLCALAGQDFDALKQRAATRAFAPVPLGVTASMTLNSRIRTLDSRNVAGILPGSDPALTNEYVIYTAHWDHYGIGPEINGDRIYNGALDNATGVGGMIEVARAFAALPVAPKRSLLFLAVTAEEQGLLGSDYYARHPIYPLNKTLAVVNMDGLNIYGRTKDLTVVGTGRVGSRRLCGRGGWRAGTSAEGRSETRERRVLPVRSLPVREAGRAGHQRRRRRRLHRPAGRLGPAGVGRLHRPALPQAVGRNPPGLGSERRARRHADLLRHRRPRRVDGGLAPVEARQRVQGAAGQDAGEVGWRPGLQPRRTAGA